MFVVVVYLEFPHLLIMFFCICTKQQFAIHTVDEEFRFGPNNQFVVRSQLTADYLNKKCFVIICVMLRHHLCDLRVFNNLSTSNAS